MWQTAVVVAISEGKVLCVVLIELGCFSMRGRKTSLMLAHIGCPFVEGAVYVLVQVDMLAQPLPKCVHLE